MAEQDSIDIADEIPSVGYCQSYLPGHQSHWIMVKKYRSAPSSSAVVVAIEGTEITLHVGHEVLTWRHHEPARLLAALRQLPRTVRILDERTAILVKRGTSTYWFYCTPEDLEDCAFIYP